MLAITAVVGVWVLFSLLVIRPAIRERRDEWLSARARDRARMERAVKGTRYEGTGW